MRDPPSLIEIAERGVKMALELGAEDAEIYVQESENSKVSASGRHIAPASSADTAIGVRIVRAGRVGGSGASSPARLRAAIHEALQSVAGVAAPKHAFVLQAPRADTLARVGPAPIGSPEAQAAFVTQLIDAALRDAHVDFVECKTVESHRRIAIANSRGLATWEEVVTHRVDAEVRCSRGTTKRSGQEARVLATPVESWLEPAAFIEATIARVTSALEPGSLSGGAVDEAIFTSASASQILSLAANALVSRRDAAEPSGQAAYAPCISIRDEPRDPSGAKRRNIDDEGVPTAPLTLVDRGRIVALMHDTQSAARAGVASTGHGMRAVPSAGVSPRPINLTLAPGSPSFEDLVASATRAIIVPEPFLGGFTSNKATGDFSVVAPYAFLVEGGKIRHALGPTTLGGNAHHVLAAARQVGRDAQACGGALTPALRAGGVSCAA